MATARRRRPIVYHNTTNVTGEELRRRIEKCEGQNEQFLELFRLYGNMTKWNARRLYIEHFGPIDEIQPGRAINSLMDKGLLYKSTEQLPEERGANNFVYKLFPTDGTIPTDFNNNKEKIIVEVQFNEDGTVDLDATSDIFIKKLTQKDLKYS